jgi:hypothetical protein
VGQTGEAEKREGLNQLSKIYKYFTNMTCQRSSYQL